MKHVLNFKSFVNESENAAMANINEATTTFKTGAPGVYSLSTKISDVSSKPGTVAKKFDFTLEIQHEGAGWAGKKIKDSFTLAMSKDSTGIYTLGKDIEKFTGVPEKDVIKDVNAGKETPTDAIIYGMCNIMNGGKDIYFWTNGTRLAGEVAKPEVKLLPGVMEQLSHEAGIHLTRLILTRAVAKMNNISIKNDDWVTADYGAGEYSWPAIGDPNDDTPKIIAVDEETFATTSGAVVLMIAETFFDMASAYIPKLKNFLVD